MVEKSKTQFTRKVACSVLVKRNSMAVREIINVAIHEGRTTGYYLTVGYTPSATEKSI